MYLHRFLMLFFLFYDQLNLPLFQVDFSHAEVENALCEQELQLSPVLAPLPGCSCDTGSTR